MNFVSSNVIRFPDANILKITKYEPTSSLAGRKSLISRSCNYILEINIQQSRLNPF